MTPAQIAVLTGSIGAVCALVGSLVTALINRRGQDQSAADSLRDDMMQWVGVLRKEVDDLRRQVARIEAERRDDEARFRARIEQLESWGIHAPEPPPRVVPPWPAQPTPTGGAA